MASKQIFTYATREDFALGLKALEAEQPILYVQGDLCDSPDFPVYRSYQEIPDLGKAVKGHWISERDFRVLISAEDLVICPFELWDGGTRYKIGRRTVERSLIWRPGGVMEAKKVVIQGQIGNNQRGSGNHRLLPGLCERGDPGASTARAWSESVTPPCGCTWRAIA